MNVSLTMLSRYSKIAHPFPIVMFFIRTIYYDVFHMMVFVAPHVFMDVAELMHFTDDRIGRVIKVGNGGGVPKVARTRPTRMFVMDVSKHGGQE